MILDLELEKVLRKDHEDGEMITCVNLIYEYSTPHGILINNIDVVKLPTIFKESLTKKVEEYYSNPLHDYFLSKQNESGVENTIVQFVHYHNLNMMDGDDSINIYLIENFGKNKLNINKNYVKAMIQSPIHYFMIVNHDNDEPSQESIDDLNKFRIKNKISKFKVLYFSKSKPKLNSEWVYLNIDILTNSTIEYISIDLLNSTLKKELL
tara:strand:+ start:1095 stop:1721 length:627 start_codon:yes stop_codon:yes gene_type:complete